MPELLKVIERPVPSGTTLARVQAAVHHTAVADDQDRTEKIAQMPRNAQGKICDLFGFGWVSTDDPASEVTAALVWLKLADGIAGQGFRVNLPCITNTRSIDHLMITVVEAGLQAAASYLSAELGQEFSANSRRD